jgi:voltage-gated potassium channel
MSRNNHRNPKQTVADARLGSRSIEILVLLGLLIVTLLLGTLGYTLVEGWSLLDSLYMTVITLAAVGYQEVHPLSDAGRIFTIVLIVLGFGVVTLIFTTLAQIVLQRQLGWLLRGKKEASLVNKQQNHTIICGFGRLARIASHDLRQHGVDVVIIDNDPLEIEEARARGYLAVEGDATEDQVLLEAGIRRASRLVSLLPKDSENLYVVMTSRELCPDLFIMSRAEDEKFERRLFRAGATRLISPYRVGGQRIADGLIRPYVSNFLDLAASSSQANLIIEEIRVPESSSLAGLSLLQANLRKECNVIVAAIIPESGDIIFNPDANAQIAGGATLIVLGRRDEMGKLEKRILS